MDRKEFGSDTKRGASFTDWRKDGKVIFFVHPKSGIQKRVTVTLKRLIENDDGEEEIRAIRRFYEGDSDITNQFLIWLKNDTPDLDPDDTVLKLKSAGGNEEEYSKGELLAMKGYDWRKRLLKPRTEYLFCILNVTEKSEKPKGNEVLVLPYSAGKKLNKIWDEEIEELGEEEGDPWQNPYACKVTFDKDERGSDMYSAGTVKRALNDGVRDLFDEDPIDLVQYTEADSMQDPDAGSATDLLRAMCVIDCPLLGTDVQTEESTKKTTKKPAGKPKTKTTKKPAPKKTAKPPSRPAAPPPVEPATSVVDVEDAEPGEMYVYDDEPCEFVKWNAKKKCGFAKDEDGLRFKIPEGGELTPVVNEPEEAEPEEEAGAEGPDPTKVTDCEVGKTYYTQDGNKLEFVRYNHTKEKGVFSDSDEERVFMDGDELVSEDETAAGPDPLEPKARKEPSKQTKPKTKAKDPEPEEDDDDGEGEEKCPVCEKTISSDAKVCPHCGAEFEDDEDEVPFD